MEVPTPSPNGGVESSPVVQYYLLIDGVEGVSNGDKGWFAVDSLQFSAGSPSAMAFRACRLSLKSQLRWQASHLICWKCWPKGISSLRSGWRVSMQPERLFDLRMSDVFVTGNSISGAAAIVDFI
ncbi:MAG: hypothetical protein R3C54_14830 [Parvularculaceae bacterium]